MRRKNLMTALLCAAVVAASTVMAPGVVMAEETEAVTEASTEAATEADTEASTEASTEEALELAERPDYKALDYVELGEYKGLTVEVEPTTVSDDEVLKQIRANAGSDILEEVTEGTVEEGDTANIDYEGKLHGEAFEGGTAKDTDLGDRFRYIYSGLRGWTGRCQDRGYGRSSADLPGKLYRRAGRKGCSLYRHGQFRKADAGAYR